MYHSIRSSQNVTKSSDRAKWRAKRYPPVISAVVFAGFASPGGVNAQNYFAGGGAGVSITTGTDNVGVGVNALHFLTSGNYNVAVGTSAGTNTTTATGNTALGALAVFFNTTGYANTATGFEVVLA